MVGSVDTAVSAAKEIGYPVVLKLVAAEVTHKSDIGGVILGIRSENELRAAYARLAQNLARARAGAKLEQALVAQQISGGVELVLGVQRDPEVGPVLMFGTGGVLLELYQGRELRRGAAAALAGEGDDRAHHRRAACSRAIAARRPATRRACVAALHRARTAGA